MTKVYGIKGMTEAIVNAHSANGTSFLRLRFTGGRPNIGDGAYPAIYMEINKVRQLIIENSPEFKSGFIFIHKVYDNGEPDEPVVAKKAEPKVEEAPAAEVEEKVTEFPEVTSREALLAVLKANGAKATTLASNENIAKFIEKKGLSFPNFQF